MTIAQWLWVTGSSLLILLGILHLYYTFFTNQFSSRNVEMIDQMQTSSPLLTHKLSMWKAWIGFNGSHSSGLLFIGLLNLYLALRYFPVLQTDPFFFLVTILTIFFYGWLAKKYWFNVPFMGLCLILVCFTLSYVLTFLN